MIQKIRLVGWFYFLFCFFIVCGATTLGWAMEKCSDGAAENLDFLVAAVEEHTLTKSELDFIITAQLYPSYLEEAAQDKTYLMSKVALWWSDRAILYVEMQRLQLNLSDPSKAAGYLKNISQRIGSEKLQNALKQGCFEKDEILDMLQQHLAIEDFINLRFRRFQRITEAEINSFKETAEGLKMTREEAQEALVEKKTTQEIRKWIEQKSPDLDIRIFTQRLNNKTDPNANIETSN